MSIIINDKDKCYCGAYWQGNGFCCNGHMRQDKLPKEIVAYDKLMDKLRAEYQTKKSDNEKETEVLLKSLNGKLYKFLLKNGLKQGDIDNYNKLISLFGRPTLSTKSGLKITFARVELRDVLIYKLMPDDALIEQCKSYISGYLYGVGTSLSDIMHEALIGHEIDMRPKTITKKKIAELRRWHQKAEKEAEKKLKEENRWEQSKKVAKKL